MDWLKKITSLITSSQDSLSTSHHQNVDTPVLDDRQKIPNALFDISSRKTKGDTFPVADKKPEVPPSKPNPDIVPKKTEYAKEEEANVRHNPDDDNLKALKRLRELPRGTQVDSRIAAIKNLLGDAEIFKTLKMLRWPQGVVCPRCHSSNTIRKDPPPDATDKRHYYVCLNCKGDGSPSDFDDLTGLPIGEMRALRQWVLCWYLIGFCSVAQIAKILGISVNEVMQMATMGNDLTVLPTEKATAQATLDNDRKTQESRKQRLQVEEQEEHTKSSSKSPLKPGYKSKK